MKILDSLKALADETRLRIVSLLLEGELNVNEIVEILNLGQSRVSRHLRILLDAGILRCRKDGLWSFYSISRDKWVSDFISFLSSNMDDKIFESDRICFKFFKENNYIKGREFFDNIAPNWSFVKKELLGGFDINSLVVNTLNGYGVVADLGCGNGELALLMSDKASKVIGVDHSPVMLQLARDLLNSKDVKNVEFRLGELYHLPVKNKEVDTVVINMVLHYLDKPELVLQESYRILKNKGRLILCDFLPHRNEEMRTKFSHRWLGFPEPLIVDWLKSSGFSVLRKESFSIKKDFAIFICSCAKQ